MNDALREELEAMYDADQSIRIEGMRIAQQHGPEVSRSTPGPRTRERELCV